MPAAWRIVKERHLGTAFSGEGAARAGGRWNSRGVRVVYTSATRALAALETLVHLNPPVSFRYKLIGAEIDAALIERLAPSGLPADWKVEPPSPSTKQIGDVWVSQGRSAALAVPSVILPDEENYLLNVAHPDFGKIVIGPPLDFAFDPRLVASAQEIPGLEISRPGS